MKTTKILISLCLAAFLACSNIYAQVKIGGAAGDTPYDQAILELESAAKGLRLPQLTTAQRNALVTTNATKAKGLMIFNTETGCIETYNGAWFALCDNTVKVTDCTKTKAFTIDGDGGSMVDGVIVTYKIDPTINPSATYTWSVTGANNVFVGSTTGTEVSVKWKSAGVLTAKPYGCTTSATVSVTGIQACTPTAVPTFKYQAKNPYINGVYTYEINPVTGATEYVWTVTNGTITEGQGTARIRVLFGSTGAASVKVKVTLGDCILNDAVATVNPVINDRTNYTTATTIPNITIASVTSTQFANYDYSKDKGTVTDADGNIYTVKEYYKWQYNGVTGGYDKVHRQIWMTQNLATYVTGVRMNIGGNGSGNDYNNGYIPTGKLSTLPQAMRDSAKIFGFLYNKIMVMDNAEGNNPKTDPSSSRVRGICPSGWSLPSDRDWTDFEWLLTRRDILEPQYIQVGTGATPTDYSLWTSTWETNEITGSRNPDLGTAGNPTAIGLATSMKLNRNYSTYNSARNPATINPYSNVNYTQKNSTEFNWVMSGYYTTRYEGVGWGASLWTSSDKSATTSWVRNLNYTVIGIYREVAPSNYYVPVRCVKKP